MLYSIESGDCPLIVVAVIIVATVNRYDTVVFSTNLERI